MEPGDVEQTLAGHPKMLRLLIILFISAMLILTLYSNTLWTMNLPKVWTEIGRQGQLVQSFRASGTLRPANEIELSSAQGWIVSSVRIKAGDRVKKDQVLVTYENRAADSLLQDEQAMLAQMRLELEGPKERYVEATKNGDDSGKRTAKREIEIAQLKIGVQERKISNLQQNIEINRQIVAPFDGVVAKVNAVEGMPSAKDSFDVRLSNTSLGYQAAFLLPVSATEQLKPGDKLNVDVKSRNVTKRVEGTVAAMEHSDAHVGAASPVSLIEGGEQQKATATRSSRLLVTVHGEELQGGEQASVHLTVTSAEKGGILVSNKAIRHVNGSPYVYVVEEKKGALGNTYHVHKIEIETGDSNDSETVVLAGASPHQAIVVESSEPLADGQRVRMK